MSVAEDVQDDPKTPEREATIMEELEEEKHAVVPEASNEPETEEASAPLANGAHTGETEGPISANVTEAKGKTEEPASQPADAAALLEEQW